jgi:hypothetical protein
MKQKIINWWAIHQNKIAHSIGVLNILGGLSSLYQGSTINGWVQIILGISIIILTIITL